VLVHTAKHSDDIIQTQRWQANVASFCHQDQAPGLVIAGDASEWAEVLECLTSPAEVHATDVSGLQREYATVAVSGIVPIERGLQGWHGFEGALGLNC
jgi:hypothetical protein